MVNYLDFLPPKGTDPKRTLSQPGFQRNKKFEGLRKKVVKVTLSFEIPTFLNCRFIFRGGIKGSQGQAPWRVWDY